MSDQWGLSKIKLDTRELDRIAKRLDINRERVLVRIAAEIEMRAKVMAPLDTGALRNSIFFQGRNQGTFAQAVSAALAANPDVEMDSLPDIPKDSVIVGTPISYAEYMEFGTSRVGARPYMQPAIEGVYSKYNTGAAWEELVE